MKKTTANILLFITYFIILIPLFLQLIGQTVLSEWTLTAYLGIYLLIYALFCLYNKKIRFPRKLSVQMLTIHVIVLVYFGAALQSSFTSKSHPVLISIEGICIVFSAFYWILQCREMILAFMKSFSQRKLSALKKYLPLFILIILFIAFSLSALRQLYYWDSYAYASMILQAVKGDFTFASLPLDLNHVSIGYYLFASFIFYLFNSDPNRLVAINIVMALITIVLYYDLLRTLLFKGKEKKLNSAMLGTCVLAFSPMFLGTIGCLNVDFAMACFFIWLVWAHVKKYYIFQILFGLILCTSKEPGILLCAGYLGCSLVFLLKDKYIQQKSFKKSFMGVLHSYDLWVCAAPFMVFFFLFSYAGVNAKNWLAVGDGTAVLNTFGFYSWEYIIQKLKSIFIMDYMWIEWLLIAGCMIFIVCLRNKVKLPIVATRTCLSLICADSIFIVFNLCYITYSHTRYVQANFFIIGLLVSILSFYVFQSNYFKIITGALTLSLFVQTFVNVDPLTNKVYKHYNTGNGSVISSRFFDARFIYSDANVYNRQYSYLNQAFCQALKKIDYDANTFIILPDLLAVYNFLHESSFSLYMVFGPNEERDKIYYDFNSKVLIDYPKEGAEEFNYQFIKSVEDLSLSTLKNYKKVYYIDYCIQGDETDVTFEELFSPFYEYPYSEVKYGTCLLRIYEVK